MNIKELTIKGFKSIRKLENFELKNLNILIGANGVGKSNFVSYFNLLAELVEQRMQVWVKKQGGADRILSYGQKETIQFETFILFGLNGYKVILEPTIDGGFLFTKESAYFDGDYASIWRDLGQGHYEAKLKNSFDRRSAGKIARYCYNSISRWKVYHFHDTSDTAGVKRLCSVHDNVFLRSDASNLAAFLFKLLKQFPDSYEKIRKTVQLAVPFFDDFVLQPEVLPSEEEQIRLLWKQKDSDYFFWPNQLSDGSIRFICLVTTLLQPYPPSTIVIDEPELGLHPYAITLLGALLRSNSERMQIIVSTQSIPLLNEFSIDDFIIVEREEGASVFKRLDENDFQEWLEEYSIGELWEKNVLGGRPSK